MRFLLLSQARVIAGAALLSAIIALPGCHRAGSKEEKALRAELRKALDEQNYEHAAEVARRHLKLKPQDNGTWDRLVRAEWGRQDLAAVKQTLDDWRRTVPKPSLNLDEYAGDLAEAQNDAASAIEAWQKVVSQNSKNPRVLEKIARLEKQRQFWTKEDAALSALIAVQDTGIARVNRALCRRRLHRWHEAFEDLEKAKELAGDDPEVQRAARLFERLNKSLVAIRELDSAIAISPEDPGLLADRALLFLRADDPELALKTPRQREESRHGQSDRNYSRHSP
jgi:Cytochrome c biogenesis factor